MEASASLRQTCDYTWRIMTQSIRDLQARGQRHGSLGRRMLNEATAGSCVTACCPWHCLMQIPDWPGDSLR